MQPEEWELYHRIEEYIRDHYQKYEAERRGLGFIMTVYRRRLTSSFYAIQRSLERRLEYLTGQRETGWLTEEDLEQEDLEEDVSEMLPFDPEGASQKRTVPWMFESEVKYVGDFLADLRALGSDSKFEQLTRDLGDVLKRRDSVIVFTQYTDTMDYLRDKLRHVYGAQVACYSGRGGELWNGTHWVGTSKENIKTAFRESRDIKVLLCTESASEGLNLQTCGILINYEMPWNPMRAEQRIGRIDRIGQLYDRVWIRNYFYEGTVEATVYQRLDDRIASFESVVGELQPILAQVARVIEAAAMASDKQRGELIAREIEEINRRVRSKEITSLKLDEYAAESAEPVPTSVPPLTLPELERTLVQSEALRDRFRPHPQFPRGHRLDWHGNWEDVTFDAGLYDEHPNSLKLLSYGSGLLEALLDVVEPPSDANRVATLARCFSAGAWPAAGYYELSADRQLPTLARLNAALDAHVPAETTPDQAQRLQTRFADEIRQRRSRDAQSADHRRRAHVSSLTEEIRQLLIEAAYIELALATQRDLFDPALPLDFSDQAYQRLKRHNVPFPGAIKLAGADLPRPRPDDSTFLRLRDLKKDALERRFTSLRTRLTERLRQRVAAAAVDESASNRAHGVVSPQVAFYAVEG